MEPAQAFRLAMMRMSRIVFHPALYPAESPNVSPLCSRVKNHLRIRCPRSQRIQARLSMPSGTRSGLSNFLLAHFVAADSSLVNFLLASLGHIVAPSQLSRYILVLILVLMTTTILTLLAFLIDVFIFVPNLDGGTWITLAATISTTMASIPMCTERRRLTARAAMQARITENEEMNGQSVHGHEYSEPELSSSVAQATPPTFTEYELNLFEALDDTAHYC